MSTTVKSIIVVVILIAIGLGAYLIINNSEEESINQNIDNSSQIAESINESVSQEFSTITTEQVAQKNSAQECWTIVDGSVYDITSYIPRHPGGDEILLACGTDGSSLFNERKTESGESIGSGTPHSSGAANQLDSFFIGVLES